MIVVQNPRCYAPSACSLGGRPASLSAFNVSTWHGSMLIPRSPSVPCNGAAWQVRKAGGEWRVGGLLALSRAFGDVYLKK